MNVKKCFGIGLALIGVILCVQAHAFVWFEFDECRICRYSYLKIQPPGYKAVETAETQQSESEDSC